MFSFFIIILYITVLLNITTKLTLELLIEVKWFSPCPVSVLPGDCLVAYLGAKGVHSIVEFQSYPYHYMYNATALTDTVHY